MEDGVIEVEYQPRRKPPQDRELPPGQQAPLQDH